MATRLDAISFAHLIAVALAQSVASVFPSATALRAVLRAPSCDRSPAAGRTAARAAARIRSEPDLRRAVARASPFARWPWAGRGDLPPALRLVPAGFQNIAACQLRRESAAPWRR